MTPSDNEHEPTTADLTDMGSNDDSEAGALLRQIAHAPPRRPPSIATSDTRWGESGRYVIGQLLGRGGMGTVYAATDTVLDRTVAIKVLDADAEHDDARHARLLHEAKLAASVEHDRIARVYDVGKHEGLTFVAMEYVHGGTLRQWMAEHRATPEQLIGIITQIAEGLAALHARQVVHRDLKPENVMVGTHGGIKLLDFGLARHAVPPPLDGVLPPGAAPDGASLAAISGTPGYMAPEQYTGEPIDARADIFALGVIISELVTGERLLRGDTTAAIMHATLDDIRLPDGAVWDRVPARLREDTARMLARDPAHRFGTGASVLAALRELAGAPPRVRPLLPAATAQAIASAPTHDALPFGRLRLHRAVRWLELPSVIIAATVLALAVPRLRRPAMIVPPGMVLIDAGSLDVGRDTAEIEAECRAIGAGCWLEDLQREVPRTHVAVEPFLLDRDEVTNEAFAAMLDTFIGTLVVVDDEDHHYPRFVRRNVGIGTGEVLVDLNPRYGDLERIAGAGYRVRPGHGKRPVAQVSWYGARLFCEARGKRLPTDDEWEAAARGRDDRRFPWGDAPPRCNEVVIPNDGELTLPASCPAVVTPRDVGTSPQDVTPDGVHDLAGNVAEWTLSPFVEGNRAGHAAGSTEAPRVIRGGSWGDSVMARTSGRNRRPPSIMGANLGFRCAMSIKDTLQP